MLSRFFKGKISTIIPNPPKIKEQKGLWKHKKDDKKIAIKQVKLPATVLPQVNGITTCPKSFPNKLARPSPKAKDRIPIFAARGGKIKAVINTPEARVTGPKTKWFSSLFREAISVIFEIIGTEIPFNLNISQTIYPAKTKESKAIVIQ